MKTMKIVLALGFLLLVGSFCAGLFGLAECGTTNHDHIGASYVVGTLLSLVGGIGHGVLWSEDRDRQHKETLAALEEN